MCEPLFDSEGVAPSRFAEGVGQKRLGFRRILGQEAVDEGAFLFDQHPQGFAQDALREKGVAEEHAAEIVIHPFEDDGPVPGADGGAAGKAAQDREFPHDVSRLDLGQHQVSGVAGDKDLQGAFEHQEHGVGGVSLVKEQRARRDFPNLPAFEDHFGTAGGEPVKQGERGNQLAVVGVRRHGDARGRLGKWVGRTRGKRAVRSPAFRLSGVRS